MLTERAYIVYVALMNEEIEAKLRAAAEAAVRGDAVIAGASKYIDQLMTAITMGEVTWTDARVSEALKKDAARGFNGICKRFNVLVVQANLPHGIDHSGMFTVNGPADVNLVVMPRELAKWIYHHASASRN